MKEKENENKYTRKPNFSRIYKPFNKSKKMSLSDQDQNSSGSIAPQWADILIPKDTQTHRHHIYF